MNFRPGDHCRCVMLLDWMAVVLGMPLIGGKGTWLCSQSLSLVWNVMAVACHYCHTFKLQWPE